MDIDFTDDERELRIRDTYRISGRVLSGLGLIALWFFIPLFGLVMNGVITIAGVLFWVILCGFYDPYYDKHIRPINMEIRALTRIKKDFPLPESLRSSYRGMKPIEDRISSIGKKVGKIHDYIQLLYKNKGGNNANEINKQKESLKYFLEYYDDYGALYLNVKLQFYIEVIREILIKQKQIYAIDVKYFTDKLWSGIKSVKDFLIWELRLICAGTQEEQTALERDLRTFYDENKAGMHIRWKKQLLRMQESIESINLRIYHNLIEKIAKKDDILHLDIYKEEGLKKINEAMGKIAADIKTITKNLIALESRGAIAKTSPIDDEYLLEIDKRKNELRQVIGYSASLDNEYDRFAAEMELTKGRV